MNNRTDSTGSAETPAVPLFPSCIASEVAAVSTLSGLLAEAVEDTEIFDEQRHYVLLRLTCVDHARLAWLANEIAIRADRLEQIWMSEGLARG